MNEKVLIGLTWFTATALGLLSFGWWISLAPGPLVARRVPAEHVSRLPERPAPRVDLRGTFRTFDGVPSDLEASWPRFRGTHLDNVNRETRSLAESWPGTGPPVLWSVDLGEGHAGPAVRNGRVYVLDYDEEAEGDALRCFSLDDGREIWRRTYAVRIKRNHGRSRTVPAVSDRFVVTLGPACHVLCVDAGTGDFRWGLDLVLDYGTEVPLWYAGQCPLIDGTVAVLAPGGKALFVGVDCRTGEVVWETPNEEGWGMSHSCVLPMDLHGTRTYVYCALGGVAGVSAAPGEEGRLLWKTTLWKPSVVAPSPVPLGNGRILVTAGYGAGSRILEVVESEGGHAVKSVATFDKSHFACEQHTPVLFRDLLFTVLPNDAGPTKRQVACMRLDGTMAWTSGPEFRFGLGPFLIADEKMFLLRDDGVLALVRADGEGYRELARAKVLTGRDAWGPMALVDGRLLVRDLKRMICLDVAER
jgi:outer membrane protein assembly factor BamB